MNDAHNTKHLNYILRFFKCFRGLLLWIFYIVLHAASAARSSLLQPTHVDMIQNISSSGTCSTFRSSGCSSGSQEI
jgi:hypothetical protein